MSGVDTSLIDDLQARGLVSQMTGDGKLVEFLNQQSRCLYCGFDPTADSLHIGSLVPLLALRRFQLAGHKPIALVGGATGLIGDPSFKAQERSLNAPEVVGQWVESIKQQVSSFIDLDAGSCAGEVVSNLDWFGPMPMLDFLRDIGKHFSVSNMVQKESVKQRLEREGEGISFTEFTYMILQSYDFAELYKRYNCTLQIGGSDQWGNITGGVDLVRRFHGGAAHGLTFPLITKADGTKFGKTESGTVWLDPQRTSPYAFYQFWLNTADSDVYKFLRFFTFLPVSQITAIEQEDVASGGKPQAQSVLAREVTGLVHGEAGLQAAQRITQALFSSDFSALTETDLAQLRQDGMPASSWQLPQLTATTLTQALVDCGMAGSGKQVKDALARGAVTINGQPKTLDDNRELAASFDPANAYFGRYFLVKMGKKKFHLIELSN